MCVTAATAGSAAAPAALPRRRWQVELRMFLAAYLVYTAARWIFVGDLGDAKAHARWIYDLEQHAGMAVEGSVQGALDSGVISWILSNLYLAAQLVVVPGA